MSKELVGIIAKALTMRGIDHAFGVTGSGSSLSLIGQLQDRGVVYHPVAHEGAAAMMAGACCREGKVRAVAIGIKGPGFANFFPGILSNTYENRPCMTISEAYGHKVPQWKKHKRLDHKAVVNTVLKDFYQFDGNPSTLEELLFNAEQEIPGPVHVDLCSEPAPQREKILRVKIPDDASPRIDEIIKLVRKSNNPAVILGSMVARLMRNVIWDIGVPVLTTAAAKGCIDETGVYAGGIFTGEVKELSPEQWILSKADLIVAFGLRNTEVVLPRCLDAPLVIVDALEAVGNIHDGFDPMGVYRVCNPGDVAEIINAELSRKQWGEDLLRERRAGIENELLGEAFMPANVFRCLEEALGTKATLVLDTGLFCTIGETVWRARTPKGFCGSSNGRFMGTSIPTAIGIAAAGNANPVICVAGDGGIRPYLPEIRLAVEEKMTVLFVLMSDGAYGTVAQSIRTGGINCSPFTIGMPSWRRAVEGMGCPAIEVSHILELENAIKEWSNSSGPLFIEMFFDPEAYIHSTIKIR